MDAAGSEYCTKKSVVRLRDMLYYDIMLDSKIQGKILQENAKKKYVEMNVKIWKNLFMTKTENIHLIFFILHEYILPPFR